MNVLKFADKVTMNEMNPHNFALKNHYISNLISTALYVLPYANACIGQQVVRVTRGFLSRSYILTELQIPKHKTEDIFKHSEGLAVEITWDNFDMDTALDLVSYITNPVTGNGQKMKIVIDKNKNKMSFYFDVNKFEVGEETNEGYRIVRS